MSANRCICMALLVMLSIGAQVRSHETSGMKELEQLVASWLEGLLNADEKRLAALLTDDATADVEVFSQVRFDGREAFAAYLKELVRALPVEAFNRDFAYFTAHSGGVRVGPLVTTHGSGANLHIAWFLDAAETSSGWKVRQVSANLDAVPNEIAQSPRPEHHAGRRRVRIRVVDSVSGQLLTSRVNIRDDQDRYWPPQGHQYEIPTGWREDVGGDVKVAQRTFAYVEPQFEVELPVGRYAVEAHHGMEYVPRTLSFEVKPDSAADIVVRLERWVDMNAAGWYSGDTHVHFVRPKTAVLEARGEGVNVVNILATQWGNLITNVDDFSGAPDPASTATHLVYVNQEARHDYLGHTALLGLKHLVFPLAWGGPSAGVAGGSDYPPMAGIADETHRQGGLVAWAHFPDPRGEVAVDIALDKVDSVDVLTWGDPLLRQGGEPSTVDVWYGFLNCGFRLPITAGTDKMLNSQIIGVPRVYVQVEGPFTYAGWLEGIRGGRTFATTGPVLSLSVEGQGIGSNLEREAGSVLTVAAEARSKLPISRLEIVLNGLVVASAPSVPGRSSISLTTPVEIGESSWLAARVVSEMTLPYQANPVLGIEDIPVFAHTSPVYVDVAGKPRRSPQDADLFMSWIDESIGWLRTQARVPEEGRRQEMIALFERARRVYAAQSQTQVVGPSAARESPVIKATCIACAEADIHP